jgi:cystathionine beta-lyase family protein involved in aluminum resistance
MSEVLGLARGISESLSRFGVSPRLVDIVTAAVSDCRSLFEDIEDIQIYNHHRVASAFVNQRVSDTDLLGTTGYGYGDSGRDKLEAIFAEALGGEDALVRAQFVSGTHAITTVLSALLRPGDTLLFVGGPPYDTLKTVIGVDGASATGNLVSLGIRYREIPFGTDGSISKQELTARLAEAPRVCMIQRSRGYSLRPSLRVDDIGRLCRLVREHSPESIVVVDNCYGEFAERHEPLSVGVDVIVGSLIKNPGGGLAPSGGYVVGKHWIIERVASRLIAPGIGRECGPTLGTNRDYLRGIFLAPSVVGEALKGAVVSARIAEALGFLTTPASDGLRSDIVQVIQFTHRDQLVSFCRGVQAAGPINSAFAPEPSPMPGYRDEIVMASPSFVQGSSIEVSCDAPLRQPYCVFLQGGMYWHHVVTNVASGFQRMMDDGNLCF